MDALCKELINLMPTTADKIQAWSSIITTVVAIYALVSWKRDKEFDIFVNSRSALKRSSPFIFSYLSEILTKTNLKRLNESENPQEIITQLQGLQSKLIEDLSSKEFYVQKDLVKLLSPNKDNEELKEIFKSLSEFLNSIEHNLYKLVLEPNLNKAQKIEKIKTFNSQISEEYFKRYFFLIRDYFGNQDNINNWR